jgi:hypothetical protein
MKRTVRKGERSLEVTLPFDLGAVDTYDWETTLRRLLDEFGNCERGESDR